MGFQGFCLFFFPPKEEEEEPEGEVFKAEIGRKRDEGWKGGEKEQERSLSRIPNSITISIFFFLLFSVQVRRAVPARDPRHRVQVALPVPERRIMPPDRREVLLPQRMDGENSN